MYRYTTSNVWLTWRINKSYVIWGLLDEDDDLRAGQELLNTERIMYISLMNAEI